MCAIAAYCSNNAKDSLESDVDCGGGVCEACRFNATCAADRDCRGGTCTLGRCAAAATCGNQVGMGAGGSCGEGHKSESKDHL